MEDFITSLESVTGAIDSLNHSQGVLSDAMGNVSAVAQQSSATSEGLPPSTVSSRMSVTIS